MSKVMELRNLQCAIVFILLLEAPQSLVAIDEAVVVTLVGANTSNLIYSTVLLTCVGHSMPYANITWERNDDLINDTEVDIYEETFTEDGIEFVLSMLVLCSVQLEDAGNYTCFVSNNETFGFDNFTVELTVIDNRVLPEVVAITSNTSAKLYSTLLLTCVGLGVPIPTIKWEVNGSMVTNDSKFDIHEHLIVEEEYTFIQSILVLCRTQYSDYGDYACFVEGENSSTIVTTSIVLDPVEAQIIIGPTNTTAEIYTDTALITCVGYGIPTATIRWEKSGNAISNNTKVMVYEEYLTLDNDYTFTKSVLALCNLNMSSQGEYTCIAESGSTSTNLTSHLFVTDNTITAQIVLSTTPVIFIDICTTPLLICVGVGYPSSIIRWEKNGNSLSDDSQVLIQENVLSVGDYIFTESILQLCSAQLDSTGNYSCVASNFLGSTTEIIEVLVNDSHVPPQITNLTQTVTAQIGETGVLTCTASGFPSPKIQWSKNNITISNDSTVTITEFQLENEGMVFTQSIVNFSSLLLSDMGEYTCVAISDCFTTNSTTALVVVVLPEIVIVTENVTAEINTTILLTCIAYGIPSPELEWLIDGSSMVESDYSWNLTTKQEKYGELSFIQSTLTVCSIQLNHMGQYTCSASNIQASVNQTVEVEVLDHIMPESDPCSVMPCDTNAECKQEGLNSTNVVCTCKAPDYYGNGFNCSEISFFEKNKTPILSAVGSTAAFILIVLCGTLYGYIHVGRTLGCSTKALKKLTKKNGNENDLLIEKDSKQKKNKHKENNP